MNILHKVQLERSCFLEVNEEDKDVVELALRKEHRENEVGGMLKIEQVPHGLQVRLIGGLS